MEIVSVVQSILRHLRDQIITGQLPPGARLNEVEMAARLGISRAPLREACSVLEHDRLIVRRPRRGAYVAELNVGHLDKLYEARCMIESFAIDSLESRGLRSLPEVEQAVKAMSGVPLPSITDRDKTREYVKNIAQFHVRLVEATENEWVIRFFASITLSLARYQFLCVYIPGLTQNSSRMHEKILHSINKGLYRVAKDDLLFHINHTASLVKAEIRKREQAAGKARDEARLLLNVP